MESINCESLFKVNIHGVVVLEIGEVEHDIHKITLLTVVALVTVPVFDVLASIGQRNGEVVELVLVLRVGEQPVEWDIRDGLLRDVGILFYFLYCALVSYHEIVLFL